MSDTPSRKKFTHSDVSDTPSRKKLTLSDVSDTISRKKLTPSDMSETISRIKLTLSDLVFHHFFIKYAVFPGREVGVLALSPLVGDLGVLLIYKIVYF